jgi:uncharacterized membrane protein
MDQKLSRKRHIAKTVTWRIIASATTFTFVYVVFGDVKAASGIMVMESILKMVLYYYHERVWFRYGSIGRKEKDEQ